MSYPAARHFLAAATAPLHRRTKARHAPHLPELAVPGNGQRIAFFSPHPDDETIFCGAYLAAAAKAGAHVFIVLVTDGNAQKRSAKRLDSFVRACAVLGIPEKQLSFLMLPDGKLHQAKAHASLASDITKALAEIKPTQIVTPHPLDRHGDHAQVGITSQRVARETGFHGDVVLYLDHFPPTFPYPRVHDESLYIHPPYSLRATYDWHSFPVDTALLKQKCTALNCYENELKVPVLKSHMLAFLRRNELYAVEHY